MSTDENMFREVMGAITQGQRARARDLLTRLLKTDQHNIEYWLWMSSVVDTPQERIYCLETVMRLDPGNATARRGLILAGGLPPGDTVTPAPPPRRKWSLSEAQAAAEPQRRIGFIKIPRLLTTPAGRPFLWGGIGLFGLIVLLGVMAVAGLFSGPRKFRGTITPDYSTRTPLPAGLPSATARFRTPTATLAGPTPLWVFMQATYTATPRYVATPHAAVEAYQAGLRAYDQGNLSVMVNRMQQAVQYDQNAADLWFYLGEGQRLNGDYNDAVDSYNKAISVNSSFAPAYLGRALAHADINPQANVLNELQKAIDLDSNYLDAYYWHAFFSLQANDAISVQKDLKSIERLAPQSLSFYVIRSMLYLLQGKPDQALQDAQSAHETDVTSLMGYYVLGKAYYAQQNYDQAALFLYTYQLFNPNDSDTLVLYGISVYQVGEDYAGALNAFDRAINQNDKLAEAYHYRGLSYLALDDATRAVKDINKALSLDSNSFDIRVDFGRALLAANNLQTAYEVMNGAENYAEGDQQLAQVYYWRAKVLDAAGNHVLALADWRALLSLPTDAVPSAWRSEALSIVPTLTPTPTSTPVPSITPTQTQTITMTPAPTNTATITPLPSRTPIPSRTPVPTSTRQPTRTDTPTATLVPTETTTATQVPTETATPTSKP